MYIIVYTYVCIYIYIGCFKLWRDPMQFTKICASDMAHCVNLHQTSIIFRHLKILLAHRWSKWTSFEAGKSNISVYYKF